MTRAGAAGLTYATYFEGTVNNTNLNKLFLDATSQVVFCGATSADIPLTPTRFQPYSGALASRITDSNFVSGDAYIARINPAVSGTAGVTYSSYVGGSDSDAGVGCGLDPKGHLVVTGWSFSTNNFLFSGSPIPFKVTTGADAISIFLIIIDPKVATGYVDSFLVGGDLTDFPIDMAIDAQGFAYVVGQTRSKAFPFTFNVAQPTFGGEDNALLAGLGAGDAFLLAADLKVRPPGAVGLILESGDFQFGPAGSALAVPLRVHLADSAGNPVNLAGYPVGFTATNATVDSALGLTTSDGTTSTNVRLGSSEGTVLAEVRINGFTGYTFRVKVAGGTLPSSVAILSGDKQSGKAGAVLPQPLVVQLRDSQNAALPLAGFTVQFKATNARVSAVNVITDANGRASTLVTLGTQGAPTVQVIVGSLPAVTATYTVTSPVINAGGVVSAATFQGASISPGLIVTLFGLNIGPPALVVNAAGSDGKFSTVVGETRVLFDGVAAPMIYASSGQTSTIVPYAVAGKTAIQVIVEYQGVASAASTVAVTSPQLGLFSANSSGSGQGAILNQDNSINSATNPAGRNGIIILFGTGEGQTDPPGVDGQLALSVYPKPKQPVTAKINGIPAEVLYYGAAPTLVAGALQINVRIPAGVPDGDALVEIFEGSNQSPATITVAVKGQQ